LEVTYFDEKPGASGEEKFSRTRHISSLSFHTNDRTYVARQALTA
jgi:hypothetical protein